MRASIRILADGTILMPATVNWASSEGNAVSALLSTMLAEQRGHQGCRCFHRQDRDDLPRAC